MMLTLHYRKLNHNNGLQTHSTDGLQTFIYAIYSARRKLGPLYKKGPIMLRNVYRASDSRV